MTSFQYTRCEIRFGNRRIAGVGWSSDGWEAQNHSPAALVTGFFASVCRYLVNWCSHTPNPGRLGSLLFRACIHALQKPMRRLLQTFVFMPSVHGQHHGADFVGKAGNFVGEIRNV